MSQLNNRLLTVAIVVFIATTIASNGAVQTMAQTSAAAVQNVFVTNTNSDPVPTTIRNPRTSPVWVRDADDLGRPFSESFTGTFQDNSSAASAQLTVPANKRMTIEVVSVSCYIPSSQTLITSRIRASSKGLSGAIKELSHYLPLELLGTTSSQKFYVGSTQFDIVAEPGSAVYLNVGRDASSGSGSCTSTISGHLVNVS